MSSAKESFGQVFGAEGFAGAAVGDHGPLPRPVHEHEDLARRQRGVPGQVRRHTDLFQLPAQGRTEYVVADPADEVRLDA